MMCEECGIRPAKFHLVTVFGKEKIAHDLCPICMAKRQKQLPGLDLSNLSDILEGIMNRPEAVNEAPEPDAAYIDLVCEQCGTTYREFHKTGRLGCTHCYKVFREPLTKALKRLHGSTQHAGRVPDGEHSSVSLRLTIDRLKEKLRVAIDREEYEQAATLRDAIRTLTAQMEQHKESGIRVYPQNRIPSEGGDMHA